MSRSSVKLPPETRQTLRNNYRRIMQATVDSKATPVSPKLHTQIPSVLGNVSKHVLG